MPDRCNSQTSCIDTVFRTLQSRVLGQDITRRTSRFFVRHPPPPPPRLPEVMHLTISPRASPSIFAYCMLSNQKLEVKRPGNEAIYSTTISRRSLLKPRTVLEQWRNIPSHSATEIWNCALDKSSSQNEGDGKDSLGVLLQKHGYSNGNYGDSDN